MAAHIMITMWPWPACLPSLMLIAKAVFLLAHGHTDTHIQSQRRKYHPTQGSATEIKTD